MRVSLFVQVLPERTPWGTLRNAVRSVKVTRRRPKVELPGHRLFAIDVDIPVEHFETPTALVEAKPIGSIR